MPTIEEYEPTEADRRFAEEIDTILSCGNPQSSFAYDRVARMIHAREIALRSLLQQMLDVAENADETGYVADAGFVNLDKLHAEVRRALGITVPLGNQDGAGNLNGDPV